MPGLPPSTPYDPVETVLNFARTIANDCALSISGNLLADTQPYIYPMLNLAWRKLQDRLGNNAVEDFPEEIILTGITPVPSTVTDPAIQCYINFQGYFDGINLNTSPVLPQDLEEPLKIYERPSGQNAQFSPMFSAEGGISASHVRGASFGVF